MIATIVGRVVVDRGVLDPRMREDDCLARSHAIHVIASEAKQLSRRTKKEWIASLRSQ